MRPDNRDDRSDEQIELGQKQAEGGDAASSDAAPGVSAEDTNPDDLGDSVEGQSLATDGLDG